MIVDVEDLTLLKTKVYNDGHRTFTYKNSFGRIILSDSIYISGAKFDSDDYNECVSILERYGYNINNLEVLKVRFKRIGIKDFHIVIDIGTYSLKLSPLPPLSNGADVFRCKIEDFIKYCNEHSD